MSGLTNKQASFCRQYVVDCNGTQAAIRAGYSERTANEQAAQLMAKPHINDEIARLQTEIAAAHGITIEKVFGIFLEAVMIARQKESATGMTNAGIAIAKLAGLWIEKTEDMAKRDLLEGHKSKLREIKTAAEMLADVAESMSLPRDATPGMIVGSMAGQPIATPEAFKLFRQAQQIREDEGLL